MHLSILADAFASDAFDDCARVSNAAARAHRDGILRGLAVLGIAAVLLGLTLLSGPANAGREPTYNHGAALAINIR